MKKIKSINVQTLRHNEHAEFNNKVRDAIVEETPQKLGLVDILTLYVNVILAEQKALQVEVGSAFTKTIAETDEYRDRLFRGFELLVQAYTYHFTEAIQISANRLLRIINQTGDVRSLNYNQETNALSSLIAQLKSEYLTDITTCGLGEWLTALEDANKSFDTHFGNRANEAAAKISGDVRAARGPVDEIYHKIVNYVNAMAAVSGEANYAGFMDKVNYLVDYYNNILTIRKSKGNPGENTGTSPEA